MNLWDIFLDTSGRRVFKWKHYFPAYERHFGRYRNRPVILLELGVAQGGSLQMWKRYFGPQALIIGVDIKDVCKDAEEDQIHVRIGSQDDPAFLAAILEEFGAPDIVLDDGSHQMPHVRASFDALYAKISRDGVYMVEDMMTAYDPEYGGGHKNEASFIEYAKTVVDRMHGAYWGADDDPHVAMTSSVHFYDGVVVFERGFKSGAHTPIQLGQARRKKIF